jgi:hypothetical protein
MKSTLIGNAKCRRAFASLAVGGGNALVDAAVTIDRLIVPFETWSLSDFGIVDAGNIRIPHDLDKLLEHVRCLARNYACSPKSEQLLALSRRK